MTCSKVYTVTCIRSWTNESCSTDISNSCGNRLVLWYAKTDVSSFRKHNLIFAYVKVDSSHDLMVRICRCAGGPTQADFWMLLAMLHQRNIFWITPSRTKHLARKSIWMLSQDMIWWFESDGEQELLAQRIGMWYHSAAWIPQHVIPPCHSWIYSTRVGHAVPNGWSWNQI